MPRRSSTRQRRTVSSPTRVAPAFITALIWYGQRSGVRIGLPRARSNKPSPTTPEDLFIHGNVVLHHAFCAEPARRDSPASRAIEFTDRVDGNCRVDGVVDEEARLTTIDDFRHRASPVGDNRRAAGHRLDDREPKGLVEGDRMNERVRIPEHRGSLLLADRTQVGHSIAVDVWPDPFGEIVVVLDDPADH